MKSAIRRTIEIVLRRPSKIFWVESGELQTVLQSLEAFRGKGDGHRIMRHRQRAVQHDVIAATGKPNHLPLARKILRQIRHLQIFNEDPIEPLVESVSEVQLLATPHRAEPGFGHEKQNHLTAVGSFVKLAFPTLTSRDAALWTEI